MEEMQERIGRIEATVESLAKNVEDVAQSVRLLAGEINKVGKPQWSPMISAGALVVAIIGGLIALGSKGPLENLSDLKTEAIMTRQKNFDHEYAYGSLNEWRLNTDERIERLERRLKEEMRLLDATQDQRLTYTEAELLRIRSDIEELQKAYKFSK